MVNNKQYIFCFKLFSTIDMTDKSEYMFGHINYMLKIFKNSYMSKNDKQVMLNLMKLYFPEILFESKV